VYAPQVWLAVCEGLHDAGAAPAQHRHVPEDARSDRGERTHFGDSSSSSGGTFSSTQSDTPILPTSWSGKPYSRLGSRSSDRSLHG
jgi:hypothetical protein